MRNEIKKIMKQHKITLKELAKQSKVSERTLSEFLRGITKNPHIETIKPLISTLSELTGEKLGYLLTNENTENTKTTYTTKNKANIFDDEGKLTEINISPENVNTIIAVIRTIETEQKSRQKSNITPIFIKPEENEEELIPAVARSKDNAVKGLNLTKKEVEEILSQRVDKDE